MDISEKEWKLFRKNYRIGKKYMECFIKECVNLQVIHRTIIGKSIVMTNDKGLAIIYNR